MTVDHRQHHLDSIRSGLSTLIYPLEYLVNVPVAVGTWASETLSSRTHLLDENARLRAEQLRLQARLQQFEALEAENARLRRLLHSSGKVRKHVLIGELLAVDHDPFKRQILINKGTRDGVFEGQPIIDAQGIMGQIVHTSPFTSTAMLITDPNHAIPVQFNRNGLRAIALGTGSANRLEVPNLPNNADVQVGDLLITSGLGRRFPPGYPVARVVSVDKDPSQPYARVLAEPTARLERSREVLLVWQTEQPEANKAATATEAKAKVKGPKS